MVETLQDYKKRLKEEGTTLTKMIELAHRQGIELEVLRELFSEMAMKFDFIRNYRQKQQDLAKSFGETRTFNEADLEAIEKISGEYFEELQEATSGMKR